MPRTVESPTVFREAAPHGSGVCRKLFGPVDHEQMSRDLKKQLTDLLDQDTRRWNFNFHTDTPLPGRYQWEEVPSRCSATLYRESSLAEDVVDPLPEDSICCRLHSEDTTPCLVETNQENNLENNQENNQENCSSISNTVKVQSDVTRKRTFSRQNSKSKNNTHITDFFVKRRRASETKSSMTSFDSGSSEQILCKIIR